MGLENFQSWIHAGHDNYLMTPNGKLIDCLQDYQQSFSSSISSILFWAKSLAPKISLLFNIPLIFYGEMKQSMETLYKIQIIQKETGLILPKKIHQIFSLAGVSIKDFKNDFGLNQNDLEPYLPADPEKIRSNNTEVHYLGYYLKWHPQSCYYYSVEHGNFQASPERTAGTYSKYNSIDDKIDDSLYTTGIKFGIGRATYDAAQELDPVILIEMKELRL